MDQTKKLLLTASVLCVLLVAGCKAESPKPTPSNVKGGSIVMVTLKDGTRCAVWDSYRAGGISCDWQRN